MDWISDPNVWIGFLTLTVLEIVLGVDNIIFISILAGKLPEGDRVKARRLGLALALITRLLLLASIAWIAKLTAPLFGIANQEFSGRDLILLGGGLFLIAKSVSEIHGKLEGVEGHDPSVKKLTFRSVITQILILDVVFSLDSVITAVGLADHLAVMMAAVIVAVIFMLWFSGPLSAFVERHPTIQMLALSFLVLIGANLVAEGLGQHIPKGYTYFAMAFSVGVEMLNIRTRTKAKPVHLHKPDL
ncbi:MAG: TerC family protein [Armatimonadetes bacterium]|nr:TerC family protein [Armatimonadota bacterium]